MTLARDSFRGRYPSAHSVFSSLPSYYVSTNWSSLEGFTLSQSLDCQTFLEQPLDSQWIRQALAFLKAFISGTNARHPTTTGTAETDFGGKNTQEQLDYLTILLARLQEAGHGLEEGEYLSTW